MASQTEHVDRGRFAVVTLPDIVLSGCKLEVKKTNGKGDKAPNPRPSARSHL